MVPPDFAALVTSGTSTASFHGNGCKPLDYDFPANGAAGKVRPRTREGLTERLPIASHQPATLWKAGKPVMASVTVSIMTAIAV